MLQRAERIIRACDDHGRKVESLFGWGCERSRFGGEMSAGWIGHRHQEGARDALPGRATPMSDQETTEAVRNHDRWTAGGGDLALERADPITKVWVVPVGGSEATHVRICVLPKSLPVRRAGAADARHDDDGSWKHARIIARRCALNRVALQCKSCTSHPGVSPR